MLGNSIEFDFYVHQIVFLARGQTVSPQIAEEYSLCYRMGLIRQQKRSQNAVSLCTDSLALSPVLANPGMKPAPIVAD